MNKNLKIPPKNKTFLSSPELLADKLDLLIGKQYKLTGKPRTDGSNLRKRIGAVLYSNQPPNIADHDCYEIMPPKNKGVPKILLEYVDTYIVTTGKSYNLQVWNRNPSSESVQIQYSNGETLQSNEVRFILAKIDPINQIIQSICVLTPKYIVDNFGSFGKPTVKSQLIISNTARKKILNKPDCLLYYNDNVGKPLNIYNLSSYSIHDSPSHNSLLPLSVIKDIVVDKIIGQSIKSGATKNRGQMLEELFAKSLGYNLADGELLASGYPDIRNQALEVKLQDSPTVDLGKYSPEFEEIIERCDGFTTKNMRYFIALTNSKNNIIEGAVLCSGRKLGLHFTYIAEKSYKCQRSIPMSFFEAIEGRSVFNPKV